MNLHKDYIIAEQANMIDLANFTKQIKCVFIGTNNYMFAIPYNMVDFRPGYTTDTTETTDMYYEGMGLQEFLLEKVKEPGLDVKDFEQFVINENFNDVQILNIETDMNRFKVQANFWGSGISYNKREGRVGWKPFVLRYKKEKKDVLDFYKSHPKYVAK
ncbi:MAG: hypothetical protein P8Q14_08585 [Vicingaceae bacterium]|nr:hypothetical protein [Vicingaceae bacterium]